MFALIYSLLYLLNKTLPWADLYKVCKDIQDPAFKKSIIKSKKSLLEDPALKESIPEVFVKWLTYTTSLKFNEKIDYDYILKLFPQVVPSQQQIWAS